MSKRGEAKKSKYSITVNGTVYRWGSDNDKEMNAIFDAWAKRNWLAWFDDHLSFPFQAERIEEDDDDGLFRKGHFGKPFRMGSTMTITGLSEVNEGIDLDFDGVIADAEHGRKKGTVPLQDLEVVPPDDPNYGPVMEWAVYFANV